MCQNRGLLNGCPVEFPFIRIQKGSLKILKCDAMQRDLLSLPNRPQLG